MKVLRFSTSLINGLSLCPDRALDAHAARLEVGDDVMGSNPTRFGSIVHEVAEIAHEHDARSEACPPPMDIFDEVWQRHFLTDRTYFELGRDLISSFIDRTLFERSGVTIATEWPFIIDLIEMEVWAIPVDKDGVRDSKFVEKTCARIVKRGGIPVVSMIDRIDRVSDTEMEVFDYKTNMIPFTRDEVEESIQLALYHMAVESFWPGVDKIKCTYDMVRHGRQQTVFRPERLEAIRAYIISLWKQAARWKTAPVLLNQYCSWCHKRESCAVYAEAIGGTLIHPYAQTDTVSAFEEYERLRLVEKLAKQRANEYSTQIMASIMENEGKPIPLDEDDEIYLMPNRRYEYPMDAVLPVLQAHQAVTLLKFCGSVSRPELDKLLKGRDKLAAEIEPLLVTSFVSPTLKKRKRDKPVIKPKKKGAKK